MNLIDRISIGVCRLIGSVSRGIGLGAGATWPGEIALNLNPLILKSLVKQLKGGVIIVAGTNGKTTTSLMIKKILEHEGKIVVHNKSGANLINGIVSSFIQHSSWTGEIKADWGVLEVDENSLPIILEQIFSSNEETSTIREVQKEEFSTSSNNKRLIVVLLNLFRDQLDRYGEVDVIAEKWLKALSTLDSGNQAIKRYQISYILNADDPLIAHLGMSIVKDRHALLAMTKNNVRYFGVDDPSFFLNKMEHATDSTFCLNCGHRLNYDGVYYAHIGIWHCENCGEKRPKPDLTECKSTLPGLYNYYNTLAAVSVGHELNISDKAINDSLKDFTPAFGRQEEFVAEGKKIKVFLSKNPAGFNESLRTVLRLGAKNILFALNDRIPDGRDISWIWDVDFETIPETTKLVVAGDRIFDMALRIKYAGFKTKIEPDLSDAIEAGLKDVNNGEILYILPTYSAMLEVRKILTGRKIL